MAGAVAMAVLFVLASVTALALTSGQDDTDAAPEYRRTAGPVPTPSAPAASPTPESGGEGGRAGVGQLDAIATAAMPEFDVAAAQPHALAPEDTAPAPLRLPQSTDTITGVGSGFPRTPEGAVAQLAALSEAGMGGMDPATYAAAYRGLSLPGAPDPAATTLHQIGVGARAEGGLEETGPTPGVTVSFQVAAGLVKGSTATGDGVVACVLGVLTAVTDTSSVRVGVGDCQALRWESEQWRISPTVLPASAPATWPGTAEAHQAGYRAVLGDEVVTSE